MDRCEPVVFVYTGLGGTSGGGRSLGAPGRRAEINARIDELLREAGELILDWDPETARTWGRLQHSAEVKRKPQALWDSLIDALAVRHGAVIATRNTQDFRYARTFNPWTGKEQRP